VTAGSIDSAAAVPVRERAAPASAVRLGWTSLAVVFATAATAVTATIGPDSRWLAALGRLVVERREIPHGIPFAAAPSGTWHNVPLLSELTFHGLFAGFGDRGLLAAQVVAVAAGMAVLSRDMRRSGATDAGGAIVMTLLVPGALLAFAGIKAQLFSLALFPVAVALLRAEARRPSRRIWLVVPLLALWSNLHGAALLGLAVALAYLLLARARHARLESLLLGAAAALALCATPALAGTPQYYGAVMTSEAAKRGYGLWAPLSLHAGFDLVLVAVALPLLAAFVCARPRAWELTAAAGLAGLTVHAARDGVWLLLFVAVPAAKAVRLPGKPHQAVVHGIALVLICVAGLAFVRGPSSAGAGDRLVREAIAAAHGGPILAEPASAERIAVAGGRVWISNPLDAFAPAAQRAYLDWLDGKRAGDRLLAGARTVVVTPGSPAAQRLARDDRFRVTLRSARAVVFVRA
jgi:hypothetical protein